MSPLDAGTVQVGVEPDLRGFGTKLSAGINSAVGAVEKGLSSKLKSLGSQMNTVGSQLTRGVTLPIIGIGAVAVKSAIDFETSFTGVRKTVAATEAQLAKLSGGLRDLSKATGTNVNELNAIAEAAGALGVKTDDILGFVDVVNKLAVSTDLTAESAATALGKLQNVLGLTSKDYERFAAALVDLGNTGASTESEVVEMALRIAGTGKTVGLTTSEILAFSAAAADAGIAAERGGTSISKTFQDISVAVAEGGKDLAGFAKVAKSTAPAFAKLFGKDPAKATAAFIDGLRDIRKEAGPGGVILALKALGITESRQIDTLQLLANAQSGVNEKIGQSKKAYEDATAAQIEFDKKQETTERKLARIKAAFTDTFITLGERLIPVLEKNLPTIERIGDAIADMVEAFGNLDPGTQEKLVKAFALFAVGGPILKGLGGVTSLLGNIGGLFRTIGRDAGTAAGAKGVGGLLTSLKGLKTIGRIGITIGVAIALEEGSKFIFERIFGQASTLAGGGLPPGEAAAAALNHPQKDTLKAVRAQIAGLRSVKAIGEETAQSILKATDALVLTEDQAKRVYEGIGEIIKVARRGGDVGDAIEKVANGMKSVADTADVSAGKFTTATGDMASAFSNQFGELAIKIDDTEGMLKRMVPIDLAEMGKKEFVEMAEALGIPLDAAERLRTKLQLLERDYQINVRVNTILSGPDPTALGLPFSPGLIAPGFHKGGYIPSMHSGGLRPDERYIKAQAGEFMMQRSAVNRIGVENLERLNAGESLAGAEVVIHNTIDLDGKTVARQTVHHFSRESDRRRRARV